MPVAATAPGLNLTSVLHEADRQKKAAQMQYLARQFRAAVLDILHEKGTGRRARAIAAGGRK
jgi:hypothetical protein